MDILHRIEIDVPASQVYQALTEQEKLSAWWAKCETSGQAGDPATFYFGCNQDHSVTMKIVSLEKDKNVRWQCIDGPWANMGEFEFSLEDTERGSALNFSHRNWPDGDNFFRHCNAKWALFLGGA